MGIFFKAPDRDEDGQLVAAPYSTPRPITAAASRLHLNDASEIESLRRRRQSATWQRQSWEYYDLIGELKFAANLVGAIVSRVKIYSAYVLTEDMAPAPLSEVEDLDKELVKAANNAMRLLSTGTGGLSGFLRDMAINLFVAGECFLVQQPERVGKPGSERWQVRSVDEVVTTPSTTNKRGSGVSIKPRSNAQVNEYIHLPSHAFVGRIWRMHPRWSDEADSSVHPLLELMEELLLLNKDARATIKSRLNAGILLIPDELSNLTQPDGSADDTGLDVDNIAELSNDETDSFEEELERAMMQPIADESSASAVVPLIVRGPKDDLSAIRHIQISRAFDAMHAKRADKVLDRILAGLDLPKDMVSGIADAKYSNASAIEESLLKSHIEPMILQIVDALTIVFLRPVLTSLGFTDEQIDNVVVWYDPSAITTKPSKADAAGIGFEKRAISAKAWRRANGFHEGDAPTDLEIAQRLAVERGLLSEPVTEALLRTLIPSLLQQVQQEQIEQGGDTQQVLEKISGDQIPDPNVPSENTSSPEPPVELIDI